MEEHNQTKKELIYEIIRFLIVGGTATIVDYIVYYLFREWILPPELINNQAWDTASLVIATALGFTVGLIVNWLLSISFVFKNVKNKEESSSKKSFVKFTIIGVCGLIITEVGINLGVMLLPNFSIFSMDTFLGLEMKEWVMKCVMTCIVLVFNYIGRKIFIFK